MTDKELRRLSRKELLEMLIEQGKENEHLRATLKTVQRELQNKDIKLNNSSSIAEASLQLNGVFEAADAAVKQYVENIKRCNDQQQSEYEQIIGEAELKAAEILKNAEIEKTRKMKAADEYWQQLSDKLEAFYQSHQGLKELLSAQFGEKKK